MTNIKIPEGDRFVDTTYVATLLGRSRGRTRKLLEAAEVPHVWLGTRRAYKKRDVDAFIAGLNAKEPAHFRKNLRNPSPE